MLDEYKNPLARSAGTLLPVADRVQPVPHMSGSGRMGKMFHALIAQDLVDKTTTMLDSTTVKIYKHGSVAKKETLARRPGAIGAD